MSNMTKTTTDTRKCLAVLTSGYCTADAGWQIDMGTKVRTLACDEHVVARIRQFSEYAASYGVTKATVRPL